jgi:hypothetical protein
MRTRLGVCVAGFVLCLSVPALADETDNFTCRSRLTSDSGPVLDGWINGHIQDALVRANQREANRRDCLIRELQKAIGASAPEHLTFIPHARFEQWIRGQPDVNRCHLRFGDTIYGSRAYNLPWLLPFNRRIIFVADSIRLHGHVVGIDKLSHFIREGLGHWRKVRNGRNLEDLIEEEFGSPGWQLGWNENGLKGMSLTGVLSYADIASGYSGFRFWTDLLKIDAPDSFVAYDAALGRFVQTRPVTLATYVNDSWDESVNYSVFDSALDRAVAAALERRSIVRDAANCRSLASLPDAQLYVNPVCLDDDAERRAGR